MSYRSSSTGCLGVLAVLIAFCAYWVLWISVWSGLAALLGIWTDRNLDFWVSYVKHTPTDVPYVVAWVASLPLPLTFVADVIAEVAKYFV